MAVCFWGCGFIFQIGDIANCDFDNHYYVTTKNVVLPAGYNPGILIKSPEAAKVVQ
jgi:hypothetical protein